MNKAVYIKIVHCAEHFEVMALIESRLHTIACTKMERFGRVKQIWCDKRRRHRRCCCSYRRSRNKWPENVCLEPRFDYCLFYLLRVCVCVCIATTMFTILFICCLYHLVSFAFLMFVLWKRREKKPSIKFDGCHHHHHCCCAFVIQIWFGGAELLLMLFMNWAQFSLHFATLQNSRNERAIHTLIEALNWICSI